MMKYLLRCFAASTLIIAPHAFAQEACQSAITPTPSVFNFGSQTAPTLSTTYVNAPNQPTAVVVIECNVTLSLTILSFTTSVRYQLNQDFRIVNGSRSIDLQLSHNASFSPAHTTSGSGTTLNTATLLGLVLLSGQNMQIPVYVRTVPTGVWPKAGNYTGNFSLTITGNICVLGIVACLLSVPIAPNTTTTYTVNLTVPKYCAFLIAPPTANMGTYAFTDQVTAGNIGLSIRCGQDEDFILYANNGSNPDGSNNRRLRSSAGNYLRYNLYHPGSTTQVLTQTNPYSVAAATGNAQTLNVPFNLPTGQATPPAATYSDTVLFTIEY